MHIAQQLASLGVLMGTITNDVVAPETVHITTIKNHSDRLKAWHANLPEFLTLAMAGKEGFECPTLLIHCAYLNSIILLTRRLHLEKVVSEIQEGVARYADGSSEMDEYSDMCVSAGRQLAQVRRPSEKLRLPGTQNLLHVSPPGRPAGGLRSRRDSSCIR